MGILEDCVRVLAIGKNKFPINIFEILLSGAAVLDFAALAENKLIKWLFANRYKFINSKRLYA